MSRGRFTCQTAVRRHFAFSLSHPACQVAASSFPPPSSPKKVRNHSKMYTFWAAFPIKRLRQHWRSPIEIPQKHNLADQKNRYFFYHLLVLRSNFRRGWCSEKAFDGTLRVSNVFSFVAIARLWLLIIERWQIHHKARLVRTVVQFQHRRTCWWAVILKLKQIDQSGLNKLLNWLAKWYTSKLIRVFSIATQMDLPKNEINDHNLF